MLSVGKDRRATCRVAHGPPVRRYGLVSNSPKEIPFQRPARLDRRAIGPYRRKNVAHNILGGDGRSDILHSEAHEFRVCLSKEIIEGLLRLGFTWRSKPVQDRVAGSSRGDDCRGRSRGRSSPLLGKIPSIVPSIAGEQV
jgi:hypothetical protein